MLYVDLEPHGKSQIVTVRFAWNPVTLSEVKTLASQYGHGNRWYAEERCWKLKPACLTELSRRQDVQFSTEALMLLDKLRKETQQREEQKRDIAQRLLAAFEPYKTATLGNGMILRPYQVEGIEKILRNSGSGLLCDDMGVGKSLQAAVIALVFQQVANAVTVILCPKSLIPDWEINVEQLGIKGIVRTQHHLKIPSPEQVSQPYVLLIDEAHMLRNEKSKQGKKYLTLAENALAVIPLTGTIMPNYRPREQWIHLKAIRHPLSTQKAHYFKHFCNAHMGEWGWDDSGAQNMEELERLVEPYKVQRSKAIANLPPLTFVEMKVPLNNNNKLYRSYYNKKIEEIKARRQEKIEKLEARDEGLSLAEREALLSVDDLDIIWRMSASICKVDTAVDLAKTIIEGGTSILVSTFFVETAEKIASELGTKALTGKLSDRERDRLISSFKAGDIPILVMTGVGSLGLNLQKARAIIQVDRDWVPTKNDQMIGRAHRTGQEYEVTVYTLLYGKPDERMSQVLNQKLTTAEEIEKARVKIAWQQYNEAGFEK